ncbi:MAG: uroporphyrinogen-III synthase [Ramlibacter sp.]|nr:uroporphyrinogen-III synthase [Ramlibacter sp.]
MAVRVIVTRPQQEAGIWVDALAQRGFDAQLLPLIEILPPQDAASVRRAWQSLTKVRAAMFVSSNAVRHFFANAQPGAQWPGDVRAWATGPGTAQALRDAGVPHSAIDAPPPDSLQFDSETLWAQVAAQVLAGDSILIVRGAQADDPANKGRDWLEQQLFAAKAQVTTVIAYRRGSPEWSAAQLARAAGFANDATWLFSSSQAIANLRDLLPQQTWQASRAIATHARIEQAARDAGFGVVCVSRPSVEAVVAALESFG